VVGNPRFDRRTWTGLPDLPGAEAEATAIAALYRRAALLTRGGATRAQFLDGIGDSQVVHFAGHAAANAGGAAQLLLAPDANDSGALHLGELEARRLARTRVVVLAACRTAAGPVSRVEGALSLGRPLLAAGVPNVVASLWDVDDALSRRFFVALHRRLLVERDPLAAVRQAQIDLLQDGDPVLSHPASWAVFVSMGGIPLVPSKGEVS
jgi:CHAT domain-containing protein